MKQILLSFSIATFFILSAQAQIKKPPVKPQKLAVKPVSKSKEIITQKAVTSDGKSVILKSDGTWEFAPLENPQKIEPKPCNLTLNNSPVIRNLKLGMTKDEIQQAFGVSANNERSPFYFISPLQKSTGVLQYTFYNSTLEKLVGFRGISGLELELFEDNLHSLKITYSDSTASFSEKDFKNKIIESFNLPVDGWSGKDYYLGEAVSFPTAEGLQCAEFEIKISSGNTLTLTNLITSQKIKNNEENKRNVFKP
jgi:hypothetical protein